MTDQTKLMIKLNNGDGTYKYKHFAYIDTSLLIDFEVIFKIPVHMRLRTWAKEDFGIMLETPKDLDNFKRNVLALFKAKYPEIFISLSTHTARGLIKNWVIQHIREEIHEHKRLVYNSR